MLTMNSVMWDILIKYAKQHPWILVVNIIFMAFIPFNEVLLPHLYSRVVTAIQNMSGVYTALIIVIVAVTLTQLGFYFRDRINEVFIPSFTSYLKIEIINKILEKYNTQYENLTTGDIIYKLTVVPDMIVYWFERMNDFIIPYLITFIVTFIYFIMYDPVIAITFAVFVIMLLYLFIRGPQECTPVSLKYNVAVASFHEKLEEIIHNMMTIYSTDSQKTEIDKLRETANGDYAQLYKGTSTCARQFKVQMIPIIAIVLMTLVLRSMHLIKQKKIPVAKFTSIFFVFTSMLASIFWIVETIKYGVFDLGAVKNVNEMIDILQMDDAPGTQPVERSPVTLTPPPPSTESIIGLRGVTFAYPQDKSRPILNNLSVAFETNQTTAIVGPVGTGKSTILKLLMGFYKPNTGDMYFDGKWYTDTQLSHIRRSIGYIPQQPTLFNDTVLFNVRYGNENRYTEAQVIDIIKSFGVDRNLSQGVYTPVGKNGMNLSGGQRQLVWCLRVLLQNPRVLVMDEPTASMDDGTKELLMHIMDKLMSDRTVIFVSHDPFLIDRATRVLDLAKDITTTHPLEDLD